MRDDTYSDDEEVQELLNLKLEGLDQLDIVEDDPVDFLVEPEPPPEKKPQLRIPLEEVPTGEKGLMQMQKAPVVLKIEDRLSKSPLDIPAGKPLQDTLTQRRVGERSDNYKSSVQLSYTEAVKQVERVYLRLNNKITVNHMGIQRIVENFFSVFLEDRSLIQNLANYKYKQDDYLYQHALHVCLISLNIATACGYSKDQVIEIGEAGLLADVGMLKIPEEIRSKKKTLTRDEFYEIQKHPIIGIYLLEKIDGIPDTIPFTAYQHHERISGVGYTKNRSRRLIHNYAKIVAIADVYVAMCNKRPHREGLLPHDAMIKVLKMAHSELLDKQIVKCFVASTSIFPVGSFVKLTDGSIARVIQANEHLVNKPQVSVLTATNGDPLPKERITQLDMAYDTEAAIDKAVDMPLKSEDLMIGF